MEALAQSFERKSLIFPTGLKAILSEEPSSNGAEGRRQVYKRLYGILKFKNNIGGTKRRLVFPEELRKAVREVTKCEEEEEGAGKYDYQYKEDDRAHYVTLDELSTANYDERQAGGGKMKVTKKAH